MAHFHEHFLTNMDMLLPLPSRVLKITPDIRIALLKLKPGHWGRQNQSAGQCSQLQALCTGLQTSASLSSSVSWEEHKIHC